jgi:hypothetical protein
MFIFATKFNKSIDMAPIPPRISKRQQLPQQRATSTADVYDELGRPLDSLLRRQKRTDRQQREDITINRQHAAQYDSDVSKGKLIYRDVFPGRKYKLTLSDTTWMGGDNVCTIGYTVGDTFTQISSTAEAPEDNAFEIEMPTVAAVDTLEIRLVGASDTVRGYIEDCTTSDSISGAITRLFDAVADLIEGQGDLEDDIQDIKDDIRNIKETLADHEERITALEGEEPTPEPEPEPEPEP